MKSNRKNEITIGLLFILATISYMIGNGLITSAIENPLTGTNSSYLKIGLFLEFINSMSVIGIALLLYQLLKSYNPEMAITYTIFRVVESVLLLFGGLGVLLLPISSDTQTNLLIQEWYNLSFQMAMIILGLGSLSLCYVLYRAKLIPAFLSILGFVGYSALFLSGWLTIVGYSADITMMLFIPGAIFEIVFPLWIIFKGFNIKSATK